jgi:hypothetical protein
MKDYSKTKKFITILMLFILLMHLYGCFTSRKTISSTEIPISSRYYYVIHGQKSRYLLENALISNGRLSGKMDNGESSHFGSKIHIYISTDSVIKINKMQRTLNIPIDEITKVEKEKMANASIILITGTFILIGLIAFTAGTWY